MGKNVKVGKNCKVYPYAVIYDDVVVEIMSLFTQGLLSALTALL